MMQVQGYPEFLEQWWVRRVCEQYSCEDLKSALPHLEKEIQRLSDRFTLGRGSNYRDVYQNRDQLLAYGLFFFPQTFVRTQFPLAELNSRAWHPPGSRVRILDLGAGLGASAMSAATILEPAADGIEVVAVDNSIESLAILREVTKDLQSFWPKTKWETLVQDLAAPNLGEKVPGNFDVILISFSAGEMFAGKQAVLLHKWIQELATLLTAGGVLIITEPATKETSEKLEELRDILAAERKLQILGPCLHHWNCPLLREGEFWCHEVRHWNVPESLRSLNRHLYRSVHLLKFSFLTVCKQEPVFERGSSDYFRLISPVAKMKGKYIASGCAADGEKHQYEILMRTLNESTERVLKECERGDVLLLATKKQSKLQ